MKLFDLAEAQGEPFEKAIKLPLKAVLVSPHFLFRIEDDPKDPNDVRTLNDFELATRLSYFLWSSMPDEELFAARREGRTAQAGRARRPRSSGCSRTRRRRRWSRTSPASGCSCATSRRSARTRSYVPDWDDELRDGDGPRDGAVLRARRQERPQRPRVPRRRLHVRQRAAGEALRHPEACTARELPQGEAAGRPPRRGHHAGERR